MATNHGVGATLPILLGLLFSCGLWSCAPDDNPLAPYAGGRRELLSISVEGGTFNPKATWLGGYVAVFGVNIGYRAELDTSLRWLIRNPGDNIRYPVTFGQLPSGAQHITSDFGGQAITQLAEDVVYTFWVMKDDVWLQVSSETGKALVADTDATDPVRVQGDTIYISSLSFSQLIDTIDVFVNTKNPSSRGRLADLTVVETDTSNDAIITFEIKQSGVTDTLIATIGICEDTPVFNVNKVFWEVLSIDTVGGTPVYRTKNVIASPVLTGQPIPGLYSISSGWLAAGQDLLCMGRHSGLGRGQSRFSCRSLLFMADVRDMVDNSSEWKTWRMNTHLIQTNKQDKGISSSPQEASAISLIYQSTITT